MMIHKPEFVFIPHSNNTFFGVLGILLYLIKGYSLHNKYGIKVKSSELIKPYIPALIFAIKSVIINLSTDIYYVKNILTYYLCFWGWYFISYMFLIVYKEYNLKTLIKYFTLSAILHICLSLIMYYDYSIQQFLISLLKQSDIEKDALIRVEGTRLLGFGASYNGAGIINGFILILISLYVTNNKISFIEYLLYIIAIILIFVIGMMQARTILIGGLIGICILLFNWIKSIKQLVLSIIFISIVGVLYFTVIPMILQTSTINFDTIINFGFDIFTEKEDSSAVSSVNSLINMYDIRPDNLKTWLIGDAKWNNPNGFGYYKGTDVGYFRIIFYFGILGLGSLLYFYTKTIKITLKGVFRKTPKLAFWIFLGFILVLNLKGVSDISFYLIPFYFLDNK